MIVRLYILRLHNVALSTVLNNCFHFFHVTIKMKMLYCLQVAATFYQKLCTDYTALRLWTIYQVNLNFCDCQPVTKSFRPVANYWTSSVICCCDIDIVIFEKVCDGHFCDGHLDKKNKQKKTQIPLFVSLGLYFQFQQHRCDIFVEFQITVSQYY